MLIGLPIWKSFLVVLLYWCMLFWIAFCWLENWFQVTCVFHQISKDWHTHKVASFSHFINIFLCRWQNLIQYETKKKEDKMSRPMSVGLSTENESAEMISSFETFYFLKIRWMKFIANSQARQKSSKWKSVPHFHNLNHFLSTKLLKL